MKALFRVDSSATIGSGHLMRCLTLAQALRSLGVDCEFIYRPHAGHSAQLIHQQNFPLIPLPPFTGQSLATTDLTGYQSWLGCTEQQDADDCIAQLSQRYDWLVVDHYALAAEFCAKLRPHCQQLLVIDDLANRVHDCDWLLDQNLLPDPQNRYQQLVPATCKLLLGPQFALLREEFYQTKAITRQTGRLLVFFGGNDPFQLTLKTVQAIAELPDLVGHTDIVITAQHPDRTQLEALCSSQSNRQLHIQCKTMANLMHQAQLMIGAGGSTHWERCICALPSLIVTVAENQVPTTRYLQQLGACHWLGHGGAIGQTELQQAIRYWLEQPDRLAEMAQQAKHVMQSNQGARTVCEHLLR